MGTFMPYAKQAICWDCIYQEDIVAICGRLYVKCPKRKNLKYLDNPVRWYKCKNFKKIKT